ncbi:RAI1 like PD-XK nuclease-domain-containing protein [Melampsora americana]|nr:RAI1 like PD-XK nuclease-domain-containing protein [Melampsora americana]
MIMPLNLAHLLNSAPASPPRSNPHSSIHHHHHGPLPSHLTELLSPTAIRQSSNQANVQTEGSNQPNQPHHQPPHPHHHVSNSIEPHSFALSPSREPLYPPENTSPFQPVLFQLPPPVFNGVFQYGRQIKDPVYQKPLAISSFSYTKGRQLLNGLRRFESLKPINFSSPCLGFDLRTGLEDRTYRDESVDEGLDGMLICLSHFLESCEGADRPGLLRRIAETEFITWRGMLTKICSAVYEGSSSHDAGWEMNAMMVNGTIYIEEHVSPESIAAKAKESENLIPTYFGHSYESLMTSPTGQFIPVDTNVQWCSIVKANLNQMKLIIGGEVDCVRPEAFMKVENDQERKVEIQPEDFIEIKTSALITSDRESRTFQRYKMLKFWLQSFLLGTPLINIGFRDQTGCIRKSESLVTQEIPALVKSEADPSSRWSASLCLDTGAKILKFIKESIDPNRHVELGRHEAEFKRFCAIETEKKRRFEKYEFCLHKWKYWPVFRIRFVPSQPNQRLSRAQIEIRELNYETEVLPIVQSHRPKGSRVGFLTGQWFEHLVKQELSIMKAEIRRDRSKGKSKE